MFCEGKLFRKSHLYTETNIHTTLCMDFEFAFEYAEPSTENRQVASTPYVYTIYSYYTATNTELYLVYMNIKGFKRILKVVARALRM